MLRALVAVTMAASVLAGPAGRSYATDRPISGVRLTLKRSSAGVKLVFVSRDPSTLFAAFGGADDPSTAGATVDLFSLAEGAAGLAVPAGAGNPGWRLKAAKVDAYKFSDKTAGGVRALVLRDGRLLKVVARDVGLPLAVAQGAVGIRVTTGSLRSCALFDTATIRKDLPGKFVAKGALAAALADCSDQALGAPPTTTTTLAPACGNGIVEAGEECDGAGQAQCAPSQVCGPAGSAGECGCCAATGELCGINGMALTCCEDGSVCTPICAPELPLVCQAPSTFAGCDATGLWSPIGAWSYVYSIVEGAGGTLDVLVTLAGDEGFDPFFVTTGFRSGTDLLIGTPTDAFYLEARQQSCDVAGFPGETCPLLARISAAVCGDGDVNAELLEACDDGNHAPGDCCAPNCRFEAGCP